MITAPLEDLSDYTLSNFDNVCVGIFRMHYIVTIFRIEEESKLLVTTPDLKYR